MEIFYFLGAGLLCAAFMIYYAYRVPKYTKLHYDLDKPLFILDAGYEIIYYHFDGHFSIPEHYKRWEQPPNNSNAITYNLENAYPAAYKTMKARHREVYGDNPEPAINQN